MPISRPRSAPATRPQSAYDLRQSSEDHWEELRGCTEEEHLEGTLTAADEEPEIGKVLRDIQTHIFKRRLRIRELFADFDKLHCGRCTRWQFARALHQLMPSISRENAVAVTDHFTEDGNPRSNPQIVNYIKFLQVMEEVFTVSQLEKQPGAKVPPPGSQLQCRFHRRQLPPEEHEVLQRVLNHMALLVETRGVSFRQCFQHCDRSPEVLMVNHRYSGKITAFQFCKNFPFTHEFAEDDLNILLKRYQTDDGAISFAALDDDINDILKRNSSDAPFQADGPTRPTSAASTRQTIPDAKPSKETASQGLAKKLQRNHSAPAVRPQSAPSSRRPVASVHQTQRQRMREDQQLDHLAGCPGDSAHQDKRQELQEEQQLDQKKQQVDDSDRQPTSPANATPSVARASPGSDTNGRGPTNSLLRPQSAPATRPKSAFSFRFPDRSAQQPRRQQPREEQQPTQKEQQLQRCQPSATGQPVTSAAATPKEIKPAGMPTRSVAHVFHRPYSAGALSRPGSAPLQKSGQQPSRAQPSQPSQQPQCDRTARPSAAGQEQSTNENATCTGLLGEPSVLEEETLERYGVYEDTSNDIDEVTLEEPLGHQQNSFATCQSPQGHSRPVTVVQQAPSVQDHAESFRFGHSQRPQVSFRPPSVPVVGRGALTQENNPMSSAASAALERIGKVVAERRLRLHDRFVDFDHRRRGTVTTLHMKSVFTVLGIQLDAQDFDALAQYYGRGAAGGDILVDYRDLCKDVSSNERREVTEIDRLAEAAERGEDETTKDVGISPQEHKHIATDMSSSTHAGSVALSRRRSLSNGRVAEHQPLARESFTKQESDPKLLQIQQDLEELEVFIRNRLKLRRFSIRTVFRDFGRARSTCIPKTQLARAMDMAGFRLKPRQLEALCWKYGSKDDKTKFNFMAFCAAMEVKPADEATALKQYLGPYSHPGPPPEYFDLNGRVVPLNQRAQSAGPFRNSSTSSSAGSVASTGRNQRRPGSRGASRH